MEFMLDTLNLEEIKKWSEVLPLAGVTSNPTIAKKEGKIDFFERIRAVREIIGEGPSIHVQVVAKDYEGILKDATEIRKRCGDAGKRLHTARSRNDQVALDMKLYVRDEIDELKDLIYELLSEVLSIMEENTTTYMPGFTHLQKAQPTTLAHHFGAYFEMFLRDYDRLVSTRRRMNLSPLGSGAFAGTTYELDRDYVADLLDFDNATRNSMDSVSDRDYLLELLSDLSIISMHLSRLSEEIIIWNTDEYRFVEMDDTYSTGSSIMPQKKNPDIAELIRGKTGRVYGSLISLLTAMKGLPLACMLSPSLKP